MFRIRLALRQAIPSVQVAAAWLLVLAIAGPTHAADVMINNGLAPPNPANVIDDATYSDDDVYVRNVGCPPGWPAADPYDPCPAPGAATEVGVASGGSVDILSVYDSSTLTISGGYLGLRLIALQALDTSTVTMNGGVVQEKLVAGETSTVTMNGGVVYHMLAAFGSSTVTINGGEVVKTGERPPPAPPYPYNGFLLAGESSTITIVGRGFKVDGVPVPYGDLTALTGTLTGRLASGHLLDNGFYQGGGDYTGTITLVFSPALVPSLNPTGAALLAGLLLAIAVGGLAMQRRS